MYDLPCNYNLALTTSNILLKHVTVEAAHADMVKWDKKDRFFL